MSYPRQACGYPSPFSFSLNARGISMSSFKKIMRSLQPWHGDAYWPNYIRLVLPESDNTNYMGPICFTMPHFVKIHQTLTEIGRLNGFQNGGHPPSWICWTRLGTTHDNHLMVIAYYRCAKIGRNRCSNFDNMTRLSVAHYPPV